MSELQTQTEALLKALHSLQYTLDRVHILLMIDVTLLFAILLVVAFRRSR